MRAVFMGTPEFAVPTLAALGAGGVEIASVITQPDRPAGRGQSPAASPVKRLAQELGLAVFEPERIRAPEAVEQVRRAAPDVIVVVGYGQILPRAVFELPRLGTLNVHASLLPRYRGAAPIQWAIARGETTTGITTMCINEGLDTGDILLQRETPIGEQETAPELAARLAPLGAELLLDTVRRLEAGSLQPRPQQEALATYAPLLKKQDGRIEWSLAGADIANRIRGFDPWPGAYTGFRGQLLHVRRARRAGGEPAPAGVLRVEGRRLFASSGDGWLELLELQPEGRRRMAAGEFINGRRPLTGETLGEVRT